ncbi:hypothetical protein LguiB_005527 [Lonicera macranthoides]
MVCDYAQKVRSNTPKCKRSNYSILEKVQDRITGKLVVLVTGGQRYIGAKGDIMVWK